MSTLTTAHALEIPPKFVLEVACGVEPPEDIAARYGFSVAEWEELKIYAPFAKQVDAKRAELKVDGHTFRLKAAFCAEDLLESVYQKAKQPDASFHTQLESLKFFARAAALDAPAERPEAGSRFSIRINLGGTSVDINIARPSGVPDAGEEDMESGAVVLDGSTGELVSQRPQFLHQLAIPAFQVDITGLHTPQP